MDAGHALHTVNAVNAVNAVIEAGIEAGIEARNLTKRFRATLAVDDISFVVRPGRVTGLVGPNGAGKSTLMRMILGLDVPTSGSVTVGGSRYTDLAEPLRVIGALLDAKAIEPGRSAADHLLWLVQSNGIPRSRVDEVLATVGLSDVAGKKVGTFSLGMHQRLGVAAALLGNPPVLMFDEPINGLDPDGILWIRNILRSLAAEGRTVFLSSHLMSEMAQTADHLIVIGQGRLIADGPLADIVHTSTGRSVLVRAHRITDLGDVLTRSGAEVLRSDGGLTVVGMTSTQIGEAALRAGIALDELTPRNASLEDAFLQLTHDTTDFRALSDAISGEPR